MPPEIPSTPAPGWRLPSSNLSLPEVHGSIAIPHDAGFWRKLLAFAGPGYLVAVGYMDPGNWATDLAGGAAVRLHAAQRRADLEPDGDPAAGACALEARHRHRPRSRAGLPRPLLPAGRHRPLVLCEIAIAACDLAEVIGSAIALNLLFGISR